MTEFENLIKIYHLRDKELADRYNPLKPHIYLTVQEKERKIIKLIQSENLIPLSDKKIFEVGCGNGSNLLFLLKIGFHPQNIIANELIKERAQIARTILPDQIKILGGNFLDIELPQEHFDIVSQSLVMSSIIQDELRIKIANRMWTIVKCGGGILWYDFVYNNPQNPYVKRVNIADVRNLFPEATIKFWRLTLAPPVSRVLTRIHPGFYHIANLFPFFRTHILCWIKKK